MLFLLQQMYVDLGLMQAFHIEVSLIFTKIEFLCASVLEQKLAIKSQS